MAEHLAREREAHRVAEDRLSRKDVGETDCVRCEARGFVTFDDTTGRAAFSWCTVCEHSGRVRLVQSSRGFWAVAHAELDRYVAGSDVPEPEAVYLGEEAPAEHRYPRAGRRVKE